MSTSPHKDGKDNQDDIQEFTITFKNGALEKLKELAKYLGISEDNLGEVLIKGLHIIEIAKDGKLLIEKKKECLTINLKKL